MKKHVSVASADIVRAFARRAGRPSSSPGAGFPPSQDGLGRDPALNYNLSMQLVALRYFVAVADHSSFNAVAERLGVSTSTLTRSVSTLEDDLGLTLFERSRRGVQLVQSALPVLEETKKMLASLDAIASAADGAARGTKGELRLGVRSPPLGEPLRGMLAQWRKDHPACGSSSINSLTMTSWSTWSPGASMWRSHPASRLGPKS